MAAPSLSDSAQTYGVSSSTTSGQTLPCWARPSIPAGASLVASPADSLGAVPDSYPPLQTNLSGLDVCVIGGGITGLTVAYECVLAGLKVALIEDGRIGSGESGRTSAHLSDALDDMFYAIIKMHGKDKAKLAAKSHSDAITRIEEICKTENIACQFERVPGYLIPDLSDEEAAKKAANEDHKPDDELMQELSAAKQCGLDVRMEESGAPMNQHGSVAEGHRPALVFPRQATFQPQLYYNGLAAAIVRRGGAIYCDTRAAEWNGGKEDETKVITTKGHIIHCKNIMIATNAPTGNALALNDRIIFDRTYVISAKMKKGAVPHCCVWDTAEPYNYVRITSHPRSGNYSNDFTSEGRGTESAGQAGQAGLQAGSSFGSAEEDSDYIIIGGQDHEVGTKGISYEERFATLEKWARKRWEFGPIESKWSGQILEPIDYLSYTGRNIADKENVFIHTADSGHGLTHGTMAGSLIRDLILKRDNPLKAVYEPSRLPPRSWYDYAKHLVDVNSSYFRWLKSHDDVVDVEDLVPGEGAVVWKNKTHTAVYKDKEGRLHERSAVCPHLHGVVCWNNVEKSFDCPVHGSRFDAYGKLLMGPAKSDLPALDKCELQAQKAQAELVGQVKKADEERVKEARKHAGEPSASTSKL